MIEELLMFTIFSRDNCSHCVRAADALSQRGMRFTEIKLGRDLDRDEFIKRLTARIPDERKPDELTVPQVFFNDQYIGGADDLISHLSYK